MNFEFALLNFEDLTSWRNQYRAANLRQIVHDSLHRRTGWTESWQIQANGVSIGYASLAFAGPWEGKPTLFEYYIQPESAALTVKAFEATLIRLSPLQIETQSNIQPLSAFALMFGKSVESESILFEDYETTRHLLNHTEIRLATERDAEVIAAADLDSGAEWLLFWKGEMAGTGGILTHYNPPYGDLYMKVAERFRRRGLGTYLVQELKRIARERNLIPSARCRVDNDGSKRVLQKAGFRPCGVTFHGQVVTG